MFNLKLKIEQTFAIATWGESAAIRWSEKNKFTLNITKKKKNSNSFVYFSILSLSKLSQQLADEILSVVVQI